MRFLTVLSALIMAAAGAFCFAYYMNGYAGVAFVLGLALLLYGICHVIAYAIGFRKGSLPESVIIEGCSSVALGFLAIADFIPDGSIGVYFGAWLMVSGLCRFSEALAVSKVNPKNWFAVIPLGLINTMAGFVMIIPNVLADFDMVYLIAVAYILQAFSVAVYALYMVKREVSQKSIEARERAEAKKIAAEAKRKERDRLRALSEAEREAEIEAARLAKVKEAEEKASQRAARKIDRRPASEKTMEFTPAETAEIIASADEAVPDQTPAPIQETEKPDEPIKAGDIWESPIEEEASEVSTRPVFNKPEYIPKIEKTVSEESRTDNLNVEEKRAIVNLEEMESKTAQVEFSEIELPEVELKASGGEAAKRKAFLLELEEEKPPQDDPEDLASFTPLSLEELFADEKFKIKPLSDKKAAETDLKLTQTFTFDWLDNER